MLIRCIWLPKGIILVIIDSIYFLKLVLLNFLIVNSGWYGGRAITPPLLGSLRYSITITCLEFIFVNIFYILLVRNRDISFTNNNLNLSIQHNKNKDLVYIGYIFVSILLAFFIRDNISVLGIGVKDTPLTENDDNMLRTLFSIAVYIAKYFVIGYVTRYYYLKYSNNSGNIFLFYNFIFVLLINMIFIGQNRMDALLPIISSFILLNYLYGKKMHFYNIIMFILAFFAIYFISIMRGTFDYSITDDTKSLITDYLQIYLGGIYNVALSLEIDQYSNVNNLLIFSYDLIRPFLGLNFLWRSDTILMSSDLFNYRIFGDPSKVTQIIPLMGQFFLAFGWLGVIISTFIVNLLIFMFLKILKNSYIIESVIIIPIIIRLCITFFQNISIFINELSSIIIIFLILKLVTYSIGIFKK